jgi:hypothetical protein
MQVSDSEQNLLLILRKLQDVQYGEVHLECTYSKGKLVKVAVVDKKNVVLMG